MHWAQAQAGTGAYHAYPLNGPRPAFHPQGLRPKHLGAIPDSVWSLLSLAGAAAGAYHGYKRNHESIGWAIGWALLGSIAPVITVPVAVAQEFGKPKG